MGHSGLLQQLAHSLQLAPLPSCPSCSSCSSSSSSSPSSPTSWPPCPFRFPSSRPVRDVSPDLDYQLYLLAQTAFSCLPYSEASCTAYMILLYFSEKGTIDLSMLCILYHILAAVR